MEFFGDYPEFKGKSVAQMEEVLSKNSPWTEVDWNVEGDGSVRVTQIEDPREKVLDLEPEMVIRRPPWKTS